MISRADSLCEGNLRYRRCDINLAHLQIVGGIVCHVTTVEHGDGVIDSISHGDGPGSLKHVKTHTLHHSEARAICDLQLHRYMEGIIPLLPSVAILAQTGRHAFSLRPAEFVTTWSCHAALAEWRYFHSNPY